MEGFRRVGQQCTISDMGEDKEEEETGSHKYPYKARDKNSVRENFNNLLKPLVSKPKPGGFRKVAKRQLTHMNPSCNESKW